MNTVPVFEVPVQGDCAPYFFTYIDKVPAGDVLDTMELQHTEFLSWIRARTNDELSWRYAPEKWTLAEMIGHVLDTERVFAYRMLCISRGEQASLPSFEQDDYIISGNYNAYTGEDLAAEWDALRTSTVIMCRNMTRDMSSRFGLSNKIPTKAGAFAYMMVGHVNHHLGIAHDRYLNV